MIHKYLQQLRGDNNFMTEFTNVVIYYEIAKAKKLNLSG